MWRVTRPSYLRAALIGQALALAVVSVPAMAQFSETYNFIKAVKDKDRSKAHEYIDKPGTTIINSHDSDTGDTALHIVVKRTDTGWLADLLQAGANPNSRDNSGNTPLMLASLSRFSEGVRILLLVRAQVNLQNRLGETALLKAVQNRDAFTAKMLIDAGANPDLSDNSGATARSVAELDPRAAAIARLLKDLPVKKARAVQGPSQ